MGEVHKITYFLFFSQMQEAALFALCSLSEPLSEEQVCLLLRGLNVGHTG